MPLGAPFHVVPKSGCRPRDPHDAMSWADAGSTGSPDTSAFHALSAGNGRRPSRLPFAPGASELGPLAPSMPLAEHDTTSAAATPRINQATDRWPRDSGQVERTLRMLDVASTWAGGAVTS